MKEKSPDILFIPKIMILPMLISFVWNVIAYYGSRLITTNWHHINAEIFIDYKIPLVPWTVFFYLSCYLFWMVNYIIGSRRDREDAFRLFSADIFAKTICLLCFLIIPTTNVRPELAGGGIWNSLIYYVYKIDAADNLFPSIHCLTSWFCFIAVRNNKRVSKPYVIFSLIYAICVCISTLTTKQHVIVDAVGGIALAEGSYFIVKYGFAGFYEKMVTKLNKKLKLE